MSDREDVLLFITVVGLLEHTDSFLLILMMFKFMSCNTACDLYGCCCCFPNTGAILIYSALEIYIFHIGTKERRKEEIAS